MSEEPAGAKPLCPLCGGRVDVTSIQSAGAAFCESEDCGYRYYEP